jgi:hypothetical protein
MNEAAIAAKRYKQFRKEKGKGSIKNRIVSFIVKVFFAIIKLFTKAKILRRRKVETVAVE